MSVGKVFKFHNDLDTDQIIASQYLLLPTIEEMKVHTFESLDPEFPQKVKPGDYVVGGENFGCGSSREQAPGVLKALGVQAIVAKSFARIFYRNAINIGLPILECEEAANDKEVTACRCFKCNKTMKRIIKWFSTNSKSYYGLFSCQEHGLIKGRFRIKSTDDKQYYAIRILKCTDEEGGKKIKMRQQREKEHRRAKRLGTL